MTISCSSTMNKPTAVVQSAYDDSDCSTLKTYFGYNKDRCFPLWDGEHYALLDGCK